MKQPLFACLLLGAVACTGVALAETRLLRYPDVHGDRVVFTYAGNLWSAPVAGGTATQLTSHPGLELFAEFSPDGERIAFTGQYDGAEQVYVMSARGGEPKQLTFYPSQGPLPARWGYDHLVQGWTPDGEKVLFRSLRDAWSLGEGKLFTVDADGGLPEALPLPSAGAATYTDDADTLFYSPLMRDFRTWKRYEGGWAQDLWLLNLESKEATQVTDHERTDRDPMWINGQAYFVSDRTGRLNLYRFDPDSGETEQLTEYADWDVRWPGTDGDHQIAYELNGSIHVFDTRTGEDRELSIDVPSDVLAARPRQVKVADQVEGFALSPKARRALFVARGDVFTAPVEKGLTKNLTHSSNAHEREVAWSPKGEKIAFVSDVSGEDQVYVMDSSGGEPEQLSEDLKTRYYGPRFSPDGEKLAWRDADGRIFVADADGGGAPVVAANEAQGESTDYDWSPDSRWLAFSLSEPSGYRSIHVWDAGDEELHRVTDQYFNDFAPAWSPDGKVLYFLGDRMFQPQIGTREFNYQVVRQVAVLGATLTADAENPFAPEDAHPVIKDKNGENGKNGEDGENDKKDEPPEVEIDFEGLSDRFFSVPGISPTNIRGLAVTDKHLLYLEADSFFYGRDPEEQPKLMRYSIEDRKTEALVEKVQALSLSPDQGHVMIQSNGSYKVYEVAKKNGGEPKEVGTGGLVADIKPRQEWQTIFAETWRRYRDFFYVENMHGLDWQAVREQYEPLVKHVSHRSDLNYLMGEMVAELNSSHAYVAGGDQGLPERPYVALLGARFELDADAGRYRFAKIFPGDNDSENYRSPLTETGVNVSEGDYLLSVNGQPLRADVNPYHALQVAKGQPVELTVNDSPDFDGARKVLVEPINSESPLIYNEWVTANREKVAEATDGRVGYLHIPDMGSNGIREFIKWYYPQIRKDGLVVDVRSNGGGNVSQMLIERLSRDLLALTYARRYERPSTYPSAVFHGHMVCLINETSASDGDIFPWMFKTKGLGPLIGQRSWGGVIGITSHGNVLDGGQVFVPQFGYANAQGEYDVEGHGVDPDIVVANDPKAILEGRDPQLERGIEEVMQRIRENPKEIPERPADPVKID